MQPGDSILLTGASGAGKSTLIRGALLYYGSGVVVLAPGADESDSYLGMLDSPRYRFQGFDDILFQPQTKEFVATGHDEMVKWLKVIYAEVKEDVEQGLPSRYAVLGVDTISAVGRLAYNATLAKFKMTEPPPAIGSSGAPFYSYLRIVLESGVRLMRAIRGMGVHWVVASHPTEADTTAIQQTSHAPSESKIMPDLPGGFKNHLPSYFSTVLHVNIKSEGKHIVQWKGDPKKVTKSRLGSLGGEGIIALPDNALGAWQTVAKAIEEAKRKLTTQK